MSIQSILSSLYLQIILGEKQRLLIQFLILRVVIKIILVRTWTRFPPIINQPEVVILLHCSIYNYDFQIEISQSRHLILLLPLVELLHHLPCQWLRTSPHLVHEIYRTTCYILLRYPLADCHVVLVYLVIWIEDLTNRVRVVYSAPECLILNLCEFVIFVFVLFCWFVFWVQVAFAAEIVIWAYCTFVTETFYVRSWAEVTFYSSVNKVVHRFLFWFRD